MRLGLVTVGLLTALAAAGIAAGGPGSVCQRQCFVEVESLRFKAVGAGADASTMTLNVGATVKWRLRDEGVDHSVVSPLFSFGPVGAEPDLSYTITPSAGRYDYEDTLGGAGEGSLVVLPKLDRLPDGSYRATWAAPGAAPWDRVHAVRWLVVEGADVVGSGRWYTATPIGSRSFQRNERLKTTLRLGGGRSFCVEVRTARGQPRRWSGWTNACIVL